MNAPFQKREREKSHEDANQNSSPLAISYPIFIAQARSFVQKIRQVYVKQPLARYQKTDHISGTSQVDAASGWGKRHAISAHFKE
jgi:hypothetical protein